jgi:UDP-N-acetylglucosamine 2-epimerase (non-hydrolysing)
LAKKKKIILVVGARPNFMKVAPVLKAIREKASDKFETMLVHTGQHYDTNMSDIFFADLDMPKPDTFLGVGSGTHAEQTAKVMIGMETLFAEEHPDLVMVAGDVNSTLATAIVAAKAGIKLAHIESGLRSFDRTMPEEINRIVADEFSDLCFVTEPSGVENLHREGIADERIFYVGNTMIDSVAANVEKAKSLFPELAKKYGIEEKKYVLVTLHRPSNVDDKENLTVLISLFEDMHAFAPKIIFPVHPRTRKKLEEFNLVERVKKISSLQLIDPVGYLPFLALQYKAAVVLTDSGGIQEETTALGVPCITLRENTERPITIAQGTNEMTGLDTVKILGLAEGAFDGRWKKSSIPALWDGKASERIRDVLENFL